MNYSFFISYFWVLSVMIHVLWLRSIVIWIGLAAVSSQPKKVKRWDTNTLSCQLEQLSQDWCNLSHLYLMHSDQRLLVWNIPVGPQIMNNLHVYIHVKMDLTHCILKRNGYIIYNIYIKGDHWTKSDVCQAKGFKIELVSDVTVVVWLLIFVTKKGHQIIRGYRCTKFDFCQARGSGDIRQYLVYRPTGANH